LATVILTLIDEVGSFPFLKPCRKTHHGHIPGWQWQDSSGSNCERMVGREHEESFPQMNWLRPDFKFIASVWDVLEETLLCW